MCTFPSSAPPCQHSTFKFAKNVAKQVSATALGAKKFTIGLPFYARHVYTGDWKAYYEIPSSALEDPSVDEVNGLYFNGINTIIQKTAMAKSMGLGGVMIWEVGQDIYPQGKTSLLRTVWTVATKSPEPDEL